MTRILPCTCENEFQNKTYGYGYRVYNQRKSIVKWRCTVCAKEIEIK